MIIHYQPFFFSFFKDTFYILTNADGATNFKLARMPDNMIGREHWQDVITMAENEKIEDVDVFQVGAPSLYWKWERLANVGVYLV